MKEETTFSYSYSAKENKEIQEIRKRYLPQSESKFEELKRLDRQVQTAGQTQSLCVGIIGCLIFGLGMCLTLQVIGESIALGVVLGIIGSAVMLCAYPVFRFISGKVRNQLAPRILELTDELSVKQ